MDESFARYLAKVLIAKQGFAEGTVPEAEKLAGVADIVLTKSDGLTFSIVCIVDAERDSARRFDLPRDVLLEIGKACRANYSGRINGAKMPATIEIIEVRHWVTTPDRERLRPLRSRLGTVVMAYAVDRSAGTVTVNSWSLLNPRRRLLERLLKEPRLSDAQLVRPTPPALPEAAGQPALTYLMLAALIAVFVVEQLAAVAPGSGLLAPNVRTLVALGGLSRPLVVEQGEWYRLFTAALLHGDLLHLVFNGVALWMAGLVLEPLVGRAWLFSLFFVGAFGGSLMSLAINPPEVVSVGASGAIMGLLAAALILAFRVPAGPERTSIHLGLLRVFIPSMIPLAIRTGPRIDFAGHLGGALVGAILGFIVLAAWPRTATRPRFAGAAMMLALAGVLVFASSGYQAHAAYSRYALGRLLIPQTALPKTDEEAVARADALAAAYPRDPRVRLYTANARLRARDAAGAEAELRQALAETELLRVYFTRELEVVLRSALAQTLLAQDRVDDARREAQPACNAGPDGAAPPRLKALRLC
jgi:rhomboid protease GluP